MGNKVERREGDLGPTKSGGLTLDLVDHLSNEIKIMKTRKYI